MALILNFNQNGWAACSCQNLMTGNCKSMQINCYIASYHIFIIPLKQETSNMVLNSLSCPWLSCFVIMFASCYGTNRSSTTAECNIYVMYSTFVVSDTYHLLCESYFFLASKQTPSNIALFPSPATQKTSNKINEYPKQPPRTHDMSHSHHCTFFQNICSWNVHQVSNSSTYSNLLPYFLFCPFQKKNGKKCRFQKTPKTWSFQLKRFLVVGTPRGAFFPPGTSSSMACRDTTSVHKASEASGACRGEMMVCYEM